MKDAGLKPKKRVTITEPGDDDCGDDLRGLGPDAILLSCDAMLEGIDSSDDDMYETIPMTIIDSETNIYSAISYLCYGRIMKLTYSNFVEVLVAYHKLHSGEA